MLGMAMGKSMDSRLGYARESSEGSVRVWLGNAGYSRRLSKLWLTKVMKTGLGKVGRARLGCV